MSMDFQSRFDKINQSLAPYREQIVNHPVYKMIHTVDDVRIFMKYHVYAVWDFMSLLKALQRNLTRVELPWFPVGDAETRFLINEIVVGEESDVDQHGVRMSHFELYQKAMIEMGADVKPINDFIWALKSKCANNPFNLDILNTCFDEANTPSEARQFVSYTFETILTGEAYLQASTFTFGREDLIPNMFMSIIGDLNAELPSQVETFKYYLDRHIEVDGDHHSHLALAMTAQLCGNEEEKWNKAEQWAVESLKRRIELWNGVMREISSK